MKYHSAYLIFIPLLIFLGCQSPNTDSGNRSPLLDSFRISSDFVKDDFNIKVSLPSGYEESENSYPVIFLLDANLYFDIFAQSLRDYGNVGLSPQAILVGIGYKDILTMDSLRQRDYTYPQAIAEYEMSTSGGADNFLGFIEDELYGKIAESYRIDTSNVVLYGHSLGGYFALYSFLKSSDYPNSKINRFIAASPSLHYNDYYLLSLMQKNPKHAADSEKLYITYGGLENSDDPSFLSLENIADTLYENIGKERLTFDIYSNFDHMDTQFPTFFKGLNLFRQEDGEQ